MRTGDGKERVREGNGRNGSYFLNDQAGPSALSQDCYKLHSLWRSFYGAIASRFSRKDPFATAVTVKANSTLFQAGPDGEKVTGPQPSPTFAEVFRAADILQTHGVFAE